MKNIFTLLLSFLVNIFNFKRFKNSEQASLSIGTQKGGIKAKHLYKKHLTSREKRRIGIKKYHKVPAIEY